MLLAAILASCLASAADRELSGRVVDAETGEPVARAHVTLRFYQGGQPPPEVTLLTDADGVFKITNMPAGGYQVSCEKAGYLPANQGMTPNSADGKATITVKMTAQAALEGTVVDDKDMPAENTFIQLVRQQVVDGRRQFAAADGGSTDETGSFRIFGLPAGRYYVSIVARLSGARRAKPVAYPQLYYPMALDLATAQPVDLKVGDESQIKIRLPEPVPAFEIRGVVATATPNVSLNLVRQPANGMFMHPGGDVNWDPKTKIFKISHVTPGMYLLTAFAQDGKISQQAAAMITVTGADIAGIRLEPSQSGLDGTVRADGGADLVHTFVTLQSPNGSNGAPIDGEGKFHFASLQPGTYRISLQPTPQMCVRSMLQGGRDVRDGLTVTVGVAPDPIEIVLTSHCGSVDVTVAPGDSTQPANLSVLLLRKAGDEYVKVIDQYVGAGSGDSAPHFVLQGIAPGDYMLFAWPPGTPIEYANADYMKQFESYGQAITVTEDSKTAVTIDKVLIPKN